MADNKSSLILDSVVESLEDLGYDGPLLDSKQLLSAIDAGLSSNVFVDLIDMLCSELKILMNLDESVSRPSGPNDFESFCLEMRSFVSELGCPHKCLIQNLSALSAQYNRILLLDFLTSQLMAARLIFLRKQKQKHELEDNLLDSNPYSVPGNLAAILKVYGISKPPSNVTPTMILDKIILKTKEAVSKAPEGYISKSLITQGLSAEQWGKLDQINEALTEEYSLRRRMLLTRCNVTVKSFKWSDKAKNKEEEFSVVYQRRHAAMTERAPILIAKVLAAKKDILSIERTSYGEVRRNTECDVNKVLMGNVPDRGGRPNETRPPPEMPSFKKRTEPSPQEKRERGGGGNRGGKRGGRVQGGWSSGHQQQRDWSGGGQGGHQSSNWDYQGGGNYQDGYGGNGRNYQGDYGGYQGDYGGNYQGGGGGGYHQGDHNNGHYHQRGGANQRGRGGRGGQYQRQYSAQYPQGQNHPPHMPQRQYSAQDYYS